MKNLMNKKPKKTLDTCSVPPQKLYELQRDFRAFCKPIFLLATHQRAQSKDLPKPSIFKRPLESSSLSCDSSILKKVPEKEKSTKPKIAGGTNFSNSLADDSGVSSEFSIKLVPIGTGRLSASSRKLRNLSRNERTVLFKAAARLPKSELFYIQSKKGDEGPEVPPIILPEENAFFRRKNLPFDKIGDRNSKNSSLWNTSNMDYCSQKPASKKTFGDSKEATQAQTMSMEPVEVPKALIEVVEFMSSSDEEKQEKPYKKKRLSSFALGINQNKSNQLDLVEATNNESNITVDNTKKRQSQLLPDLTSPEKKRRAQSGTLNCWASSFPKGDPQPNQVGAPQETSYYFPPERKVPVKSALKPVSRGKLLSKQSQLSREDPRGLPSYESLFITGSIREKPEEEDASSPGKKKVLFSSRKEVQEIPYEARAADNKDQRIQSAQNFTIKTAFHLQPSKTVVGTVHPVTGKQWTEWKNQ